MLWWFLEVILRIHEELFLVLEIASRAQMLENTAVLKSVNEGGPAINQLS
jgi:hypothetical protein